MPPAPALPPTLGQGALALTVIGVQQLTPRIRAYTLQRADRHPLRQAADWTMVLDIDEYLNIHTGDRTIGALLAALPEGMASQTLMTH